MPSTLGVGLKTADLELVLTQKLRNWDLAASGGVRYGKLEYFNPSATILGEGILTFEGVGPTLGFQGRRSIGDSGFSVFGTLRGSILLGDVRNASVLTFMPTTTFEDEFMTIGENQLGVAWTTNVNSRFQLEIRSAWETQYWVSSTLSDDVMGIGSNLGLTGPTLAVELKY